MTWVPYHGGEENSRREATKADAIDGGMKPELGFDAVHPDAEGYAAMAPLTRKAVAAARR